jgi:hypothetical protein
MTAYEHGMVTPGQEAQPTPPTATPPDRTRNASG